MGHARIRGSRGWVTARGHPAGAVLNATMYPDLEIGLGSIRMFADES